MSTPQPPEDAHRNPLNDSHSYQRENVKTDFLTGLHNHRHFRELLSLETGRASRYRLALAMLMGDVDKFKRVNDTFGHISGDKFLRAIAKTLRDTVRVFDFVGRWGGEEFAILLPCTSLDGARCVRDR